MNTGKERGARSEELGGKPASLRASDLRSPSSSLLAPRSLPVAPRPSTYELWASARTAPAARIVAFEAWVYSRLAETLRWPGDEAAVARQVGQARGWVLQMVDDLARHGFLFRPADLRAEIEGTLARVRARQDAGLVDDVYIYLRSCWRGYVRKEADRLRDVALSTGTHVSQVVTRAVAMGTRASGGSAPAQSMVELLAEVRQERVRQRINPARPAVDRQGEFL